MLVLFSYIVQDKLNSVKFSLNPCNSSLLQQSAGETVTEYGRFCLTYRRKKEET